MTMSRFTRLAAAAAVTVTLALPAIASAHPSVYETNARSYTAAAADPASPGGTEILESELQVKKRYVFVNHGYAAVFNETNGVTDRGGVAFSALPGNSSPPSTPALTYRGQASKVANFKQAWFDEAATGVQIHATCQGVPALESLENVLAWQGSDPFYGYIPFQKNAAGFDDDAADWIPVVKTLTGVDLATVADPAAACTTLGGTYAPADEFHNKPTTAAPDFPWTALSEHTIGHKVEEAVMPLEAEIDGLETDVTDLEAKVASLETAKAAAEKAAKEAEALAKTLADKAAAAEAASSAASAQLKAASVPLGIALGAESFSVKQLGTGVAVKISGPAGEKAHVRLLVSDATRKALGLKLRTLAGVTTTIGTDGTTVTLKSSAKGLAKLAATTTVTVDVSAGGRTVSTTGKLTR